MGEPQSTDDAFIDSSTLRRLFRMGELQWIEHIRSDPVHLIHALIEWREYALWMFTQPDAETLEQFGYLTRRLILWCDHDSSLDPAPLHEYMRLLSEFNRRDDECRLIGTMYPPRPPLEKVEEGWHFATAFAERIEAVARVACQKWAHKEQNGGQASREADDKEPSPAAVTTEESPSAAVTQISIAEPSRSYRQQVKARRSMAKKLRREHNTQNDWAGLAEILNRTPEYRALGLGDANRDTVRNDCRPRNKRKR